MANVGSNLVFIFCITIVTLSGVKCQVGISQISALLGSVNDTTTNMSSILPQIQSVLTTQEDLQTVTNLLLANNTFAAFKMVQILQETSDQTSMISFVENQQQNHKETKRILQNQQETQTQIATSQDQMVTLLQNQQVKSSEIVTLLQNQQDTLNQLAGTQTLMFNAFNQVINLLQTQSQTLSDQGPLLQGHPRDCTDLASRGNYPSGPYTITPWQGLDYDVDVYCDMDTDGGGWTVFQHRFDGTTSFYRSWYNYENGFGDSNDEFWAGLKMLHLLTRTGSWELRVDLEDYDDNTAYAVYDSFRIGDAKSNYTLRFGYYHGTAGDALSHNNNTPFSTYDKDNDARVDKDCAEEEHGAWWYKNCSNTNLNGPYFALSNQAGASMHWYYWNHSFDSLRMSEMKIRRAR